MLGIATPSGRRAYCQLYALVSRKAQATLTSLKFKLARAHSKSRGIAADRRSHLGSDSRT